MVCFHSTNKGWHLIAAYSLVWLVIAIIFAALYGVTRHSLINEFRCHTMGVAIAAAAGMNANDIEQIRTPPDVSKDAYRRIQAFLKQASLFNPNVRYIYTMRRASNYDKGTNWFEFVVDEQARDENGDGLIAPNEQCELPGKPYDASKFPELVAAWDSPAADPDIAADPPYPDLMSGYAPVRGQDGKTVAIVGVDITAATIAQKILAVRIALISGALCSALLLSTLLHLYFRELKLLEERDRLVVKLQDALAHVKTLRGLFPVCAYCKKVRNDRGYWEQIEEYIANHSQAEFTHGVCPECMPKLQEEILSQLKPVIAVK